MSLVIAGDHTNTGLWAGLLIASAVILLLGLLLAKKHIKKK